MPDPHPIWIEHPDMLREHLSRPMTRIGLDTEFIRERTYWPQLALVQIATDEATLLVDPLAAGIPQALCPVLADPSITKIMHSASEDLVAFKHACGTLPRPLFDTQTAAALAGIAAGIGYQGLVHELVGVEVPKGETRSDWLRRPLSASQLDYAATDVQHLFVLHDQLKGRLTELDRLAWLNEDCDRLVEGVGNDAGERWPHLSLRSSQSLDHPAQMRLLRLLRWRDVWARDHDRPRSWILDNELATLFARTPPESESELGQVLQRFPKAPRKLATPIWHALNTPLDDESEAPQPRTEEPDRKRLKQLQQAVGARSRELGLPDGVLASRKRLEGLLEGDGWSGALSGWRRTQLEATLAPLLDGAARVSTV